VLLSAAAVTVVAEALPLLPICRKSLLVGVPPIVSVALSVPPLSTSAALLLARPSVSTVPPGSMMAKVVPLLLIVIGSNVIEAVTETVYPRATPAPVLRTFGSVQLPLSGFFQRIADIFAPFVSWEGICNALYRIVNAFTKTPNFNHYLGSMAESKRLRTRPTRIRINMSGPSRLYVKYGGYPWRFAAPGILGCE
jgi:hypothetical protein